MTQSTQPSAPSLARFVLYTLSEQDAGMINRRRVDFAEAPPANTGFQGHVGNHARAGQVFPAMVVCVYPGCVNLQVFLDGNDTYWATSRQEGEPDEAGRWIWPPRV